MESRSQFMMSNAEGPQEKKFNWYIQTGESIISGTNLTKCILKWRFTELPKHWYLEPSAVPHHLRRVQHLYQVQDLIEGGRPSAAPSGTGEGAHGYLQESQLPVSKQLGWMPKDSCSECLRTAACFSGLQVLCPPQSAMRFPSLSSRVAVCTQTLCLIYTWNCPSNTDHIQLLTASQTPFDAH